MGGRSLLTKSVGVMKKAESLLRGVGLSVCTLLVAGSLTLMGCNMDSLGGPDLSAAQENVDAAKNGGGSLGKIDPHNEETNKNGGGSLGKIDPHNEETN